MTTRHTLTIVASLTLGLFGTACDKDADDEGGRINYLDEAEETADPQITQGQPSEFEASEKVGDPACPTPRPAADCAQDREVWAKVGDVPMCCRYENACEIPNPEWKLFGTEAACLAMIGE